MSSLRLRARVPSAVVEFVATLPGHDLRFHKAGKDGTAKCDACETGDRDHAVIGVVFTIDESEKPVLDEIEGVGFGYEEKSVALITPSDRIIEASTYYATHIDRSLNPFHWYKHHVLTGARENNLPQTYIKQIASIESITDPDPHRHKKEIAIYE